MLFGIKAASSALAAGVALLGLLSAPMAVRAERPAPRPGHAEPLEAQFRGCEYAGWCRFRIASLDPFAASLYRVRPDGVPRKPGEDAISAAVRDRLNALLSSMIHQHKHIVLQDLRELDDGTFAAMVTVNGQALAADPILVELRAEPAGTRR